MFIEAKKLIGLPVAAIDTQAKAGAIDQIIVGPENGRVLGFIIQTGTMFSPKKALAIVDVKEWDANGLVTESIENLVDPKEIVRIKEVLDKNLILEGMKAKTESGQSLGEIENFLIDTETEMVVKYYLKDILGNKRILTPDKVIKIDKAIIFTDEINQPPTGAIGAEAA